MYFWFILNAYSFISILIDIYEFMIDTFVLFYILSEWILIELEMNEWMNEIVHFQVPSTLHNDDYSAVTHQRRSYYRTAKHSNSRVAFLTNESLTKATNWNSNILNMIATIDHWRLKVHAATLSTKRTEKPPKWVR